MDEQLTATLSPALSHIIERPRLIERIREGDARIVFFVAPAGYGKTTLARQWSQRQTSPVVWHRTTRASGDIAALAVRLDDALHAAVPQPHRDPRRIASIASVNPHPAPLSRALLSTYAGLPNDVLLVVDEWEAAGTAEAEELLRTLVAELKIRFLITSRARPPWFTSRRKVYGEALEIGMDELTMNDEEAAAVLAKSSGRDAVLAKARGWPAALGLAAMTGHDEADCSRAISGALYDYLATELLNSVSLQVRFGLSLLAVASTSEVDVARLLVGDGTRDFLHEAASQGLLRVDADHEITLHPLLKDLLLEEVHSLDAVQTRNVLDRLRRLIKASRWDEALSVSEAIPNPRFVIDALDAAADELLRSGRIATLRRWLSVATRAAARGGVIDYVEGELAWRDGRFDRAYLVAARAAANLQGDSAARAHIVAARAASLAGRVNAAMRHADAARACAETTDAKASGVWAAFTSRVEDESSESAEVLSELETVAPVSSDSLVRIAHGALSLALLDGNLEERLGEGSAGRGLLDASVDPTVRTSYLNKYADVLAASAHYEQALEAAELEETVAAEYGLRFVLPYALINKARALIGLRRFGQAQRALGALDLGLRENCDAYVEAYLALLRCTLFLSTNELERACGAVSADPDCLAGKTLSGQYRAVRALALSALGDADGSTRARERACGLSRSIEVAAFAATADAIVAIDGGHPREAAAAISTASNSGVWDALVLGLRASPRLAQEVLSSPSHRAEMITLLLRSNDATLARRAGLAIPRSARRSQHLSPRELEIHELIAQGLTNQEIAHLLYISESTTKVHVRHILEKLGVRSRVEAARIWQNAESAI